MTEVSPDSPANPPWQFRKLPGLLGPGGWLEILPRHAISFAPRGPRLVVTFDNMKSRDMPGPRVPWGFNFLADLGASQLAVMMRRRNDWYREAELLDAFDALATAGFFDRFEDVVFYGSSMGGFAACAFAAAAPGTRVVAFTPQSTLAKDLVPWEDRYDRAHARGDWDDPRYRDGAEGLRRASRADIFADPWMPQDRAHMERLLGAGNVMWHKTGHLGHRTPRVMSFLPGFQALMASALRGEMTQADFAAFYDGRRQNVPYLRNLADKCLKQGRPGRAQTLVDYGEAAIHGHRFNGLARRIRAARSGRVTSIL